MLRDLPHLRVGHDHDGYAAHFCAERLFLEPCCAGAGVHRRVGGHVSPPPRALLRGDERLFDLRCLHRPSVRRQARAGAEPEQDRGKVIKKRKAPPLAVLPAFGKIF